MLLLAAMFAAGIGVSSFIPATFPTLISGCIVLAASAFLFANTRYATVLISASFFLGGTVVHHLHLASVTPDRIRSIYDSGRVASGESVEITGTVTGDRETAVEGFFIRVRVDSISSANTEENASGTIRLFAIVNTPQMAADYERLGLRSGTRVRIACDLNRDDGFRNPGVLSKKTVLDQQDIDATGTIKSPLLVENLGSGGSEFATFVFGLRERATGKFRELFSPQVAGVMIASLLGNKHFLDKDTADVFREGGTFHILVISGLHITFIGGLAAMLVGLLTRRKGVQFVIACSFLWLYTIAVGAEVPVVRASLMFTVLWFSHVIHRTGSLANALGVCGLLLLAWRPNDLFTPSFQLTFVSVAAIVLAGFPLITKLRSIGEWTPTSNDPFPANVPRSLSRCCETLYWNPKRWEIDSARNVWSANLFKSPFLKLDRTAQRLIAYLFEGVVISLIVQIAMLPLVVHYFHRVTPVSVPMNLWTGVFIALESFTSLIAVAFSLISGSLALPFVRVTESVHWLLVSVPSQFSDVRWLSFRVPVYAGWEFWLYAVYFLFAAVIAVEAFLWDPFSLMTPRKKGGIRSKVLLLSASGVFLIGGIIVLHPFSEPRLDGRLHVEFLDVGQGDSTLITFPNGETMLVDGGGRTSYQDDDEEPFEPDLPSIGETVVSEFLWEKGYSEIDHIVGTHADADHIQGLTDVARNFAIGHAWFGRPQEDDRDQLRLEDVLNRRRVPIGRLTRGDRFEIGGALMEIFNPPAADAGLRKENDRSVVIRLTYGDRSFLLTGDIEQIAESEVTALNLPTDVVKVPHHGSRTSSTAAFVASSRPQFAIIPVGLRSPFGHPHREVVERWQLSGATVLTTGSRGKISFSTDGSDLVFSSFVRNSE
jgi:competence protein ComEC